MTNYIFLLLIILGLLFIIGRNFGKPILSLFTMLIQGGLGALGIYLFNLIGQFMILEIPLNPFNSLVVGLLGLPGLLLLLAARYLVKV